MKNIVKTFLATSLGFILLFSFQKSTTANQTPKPTLKIPILEYHHIDSTDSRWGRSTSAFKADLEWLYNNDYQLLSLEDFIDEGERNKPLGSPEADIVVKNREAANLPFPIAPWKKPVIITFDDGLISQFQYLQDGSIDPNCAIGILDAFSAIHPDFGRATTFFVNNNPFDQPESIQKKLTYLISTGRQIGYHTLAHTNLKKAQAPTVQQIFIDQTRKLSPLLPSNARLDSFAYPFGAVPLSGTKSIESGNDKNTSYHIKLALLVGADPTPLLSSGINPYRIPRIQAIDSEWLRHFNRQPGATAKNAQPENFTPYVQRATTISSSASVPDPATVQKIGDDFINLINTIVTNFNIIPKPQSLRGIYLTAYSAGSTNGERLLNTLQEKGGNLVVFDLKETDGHLYYPSRIELNKQAGGNDRILFQDPQKFIQMAHEKGIYTVARIVCFKDQLMAVKKPEWAIHDFKGKIWQSPEGQAWLDPSLPEVQDYIISIAQEAASFGVDEVQFDYVRFPTQGAVDKANYSFDEKKTQHFEIIRDFLKRAQEKLSPSGVKIGIDVYGAVAWNHEYDAISTGQKIEQLAPYINSIYPMIYPSHFGKGFAGHKNPADDPAFFVSESLKFFKSFIGENRVEIRPWLQGFGLRVSHFGPAYIKKQVDAVRSAGLGSFVIWNAGNNYDVSWASLGEPK